MDKILRVGALISGGGTNLQAIIDACEANRIEAKILFVGTDNPKAAGLERAHKHNIPHFVVDYLKIIRTFNLNSASLPQDVNFDQIIAKQHLFGVKVDSKKIQKFFLTRIAAETQLLKKISEYSIDLLVLAGFMRTLTPYFIDRFSPDQKNPCIMNIHPAILPSFPGIDGYGDTYRYGCKVGGCTVHFVDYGEDSGPIIGQKTFLIEENDTLETIKAKGLKLEWELYPQCIQLFAEGRLKVIKITHTLENGCTYQRTIVKVAQSST
jgi:phosphoribosylglycinamide formyltransferase-1